MENSCVPPAMAAPPIQFIVYHLPAPPPGCLFAFTTSNHNYGRGPTPSQIMPQLARAEPVIPLSQFSLPFQAPVQNNITHHQRSCNGSIQASNSADCIQYPAAPLYKHVLVGSTQKQASEPAIGPSEAQHNHPASQWRLSEEITHRPGTGTALKPLRFWCTKGTGFSRPQFPEELEQSVVKWGQRNASCSDESCRQITPEEAIAAQNKRFNKTPSFRDKKFVRTSSRNGDLRETGRRVDKVLQSSGNGPIACMPNQNRQITLTKEWRVKGKAQELIADSGYEAGTDSRKSSLQQEKTSNPNVEDTVSLMRSLSFRLNSGCAMASSH